MKTKKVLVRVTMTMKISVLKVRQLKRRSCRVAAPTTKAHLKKAAELLKLKLKTLKIQTPKIKNSCEKTKVTKKYHKFQIFNRKNYVLLIITFLQINLPLSFVICFVMTTLLMLSFIKVIFIIHNAQLMVIDYLQINGHPQKKVFGLLNQSQKLKLKIFLE